MHTKVYPSLDQLIQGEAAEVTERTREEKREREREDRHKQRRERRHIEKRREEETKKREEISYSMCVSSDGSCASLSGQQVLVSLHGHSQPGLSQ